MAKCCCSQRTVAGPHDAEAINPKFIAAPLTGNQLKELIQIPPRRNSRPEGSGLLQGRSAQKSV
jgi:hypothetical protein